MKITWNHKHIIAQAKDFKAELDRMEEKWELEDRKPTVPEQGRASKIRREMNFLMETLPPPKALTIVDGPLGDEYENRSNNTNMNTNKKNEFRSDGDFFQCVVAAGVNPGIMDPRLQKRAATGMGTEIPSDGGFLVVDDWLNKVLSNI